MPASYSIVSGLAGLVLFGAVASTLESRQFIGLWQRLLLAVLLAWCSAVGVRLRRGHCRRAQGGSP